MEEKTVNKTMNLSTKILIVLVGVLIITGTGVGAWALASRPDNTVSIPVENKTPVPTLITAIEARELAVNAVGGGIVTELSLDGIAETFTIVVEHEESFEVILSATSGRLINMTAIATAEEISEDAEPQAPETTQTTTTNPGNVVGNGNANSSSNNSSNTPTTSAATPANSGNGSSSNQSQNSNQGGSSQTSGSISREEAGQIALAYSGGRLVEVSRDSWRGRAAWWAETRANGRVHEFYICMETGDILEHESERDD